MDIAFKGIKIYEVEPLLELLEKVEIKEEKFEVFDADF